MMNSPANATESSSRLFVGVDIAAEELALVNRKNRKPFDPRKYANTLAEYVEHMNWTWP